MREEAGIEKVLPLAQLKRTIVDNICVHGPTDGQRPVVLFVHGGYHGAWCYERWVPLFEKERWSIAALDLRGHAGLPRDESFPSTTISDFADDVITAARWIGGPVVLAAHSMGAAIAAVAATRMQVAGLILLAPSPPGNVPGLTPLQCVPEGKPYGPIDEATCRRRFFPHHGNGDIRYLLDRLCSDSPVAINERRRLATIIDPALIKAPALLLSAGGDDPVLHEHGLDERTAAFFGAEFHVLPDAGHCFMLDGDVETPVKIMIDWLRRNFPGAVV